MLLQIFWKVFGRVAANSDRTYKWLWIDGIIDLAETRGVISRGIEMATHNTEILKSNPGVIQT